MVDPQPRVPQCWKSWGPGYELRRQAREEERRAPAKGGIPALRGRSLSSRREVASGRWTSSLPDHLAAVVLQRLALEIAEDLDSLKPGAVQCVLHLEAEHAV